MKKELRVMYKFVTGFALTVIILSSCKDELSKTGLGLLDKGDLVTIRKETIGKENIKAYTVTDKKQRTDEPTNNLLGSFNDPVFGKTTTDFAIQLRIQSFPTFNEDAIIDSLVYYVAYKELYGSTISTPQKLKVYELNSALSTNINDKYYQDVDLKALAKSEVLADYSYIPKFKLDSLTNLYGSTKVKPKDTVTQEIAFHLNHSLARKLMALDSITLSDNELFLEKFKGLYVEAEDLNQGGTIMRIIGSGMVLYYRQLKDQKMDTIPYTFYSTSNAARVNRFTHDYSTARFATTLDKPDQPDSLIYLQTTGGLASKIFIPRLGSLKTLFPSLGSDTTNLAINKAELIFQVDSILTDTTALKVLSPPYQLILSALGVDTLGNEVTYFPSDLGFSQAYFGGFYNSKDKTYRFNIAKHLQEMIDKEPIKRRKNLGFYLSTGDRNTIFKRVILKGTTSKTGIRLDITYSKIN